MRRAITLAAALTAACTPITSLVEYPVSPRGTVVDDYHGTAVADPYRWLEDLESPQTSAWVEAQNALTQARLSSLPLRSHFSSRMAELIDYERFGVPVEAGGNYFFEHNLGTQERNTLRVSKDPATLGRVLIDPTRLSVDDNVSVPEWSPSRDGQLMAYARSVGGSDWKTWHVRRVATGEDLPDMIRGVKFSNLSWLPDNSGFYYSRYPKSGDQYDDQQQVSVYLHLLGTPQSSDELVFAVADHPSRNPYALVTEDGRFLVISLFDGYDKTGIYAYRLEAGKPAGELIRLFDTWDARYRYLGNVDDEFYVLTSQDAPTRRIISVSLANPVRSAWREIVAAAPEAIESARLMAGELFVTYIKDARSRLRQFSLDGSDPRDVVLPGPGSLRGLSGRQGSDEVFVGYTDYTMPTTVFRLDAEMARVGRLREQRPSTADARELRTRQVFARSPDGTQVPMTIIEPAGAPRGVPRPTVLYGYGGFSVSVLPGYSVSRAAWLDAGGSFAVANIRGGGEYGEAWHQAGTRLNKQNVFDDFIAAAEYLIETGVTSADKLAIWGGSNGGLLVAAVAQQRPELFAAVIPAVGVLDMLRYDRASANARQWSSDYGLSENADEFEALFAYSPYHNLREGQCYPATLVMADANDDRVVPWHSYKYAAALQYAQGCIEPTLIRVETNTGHGAGASVSKIIEEYGDQWAFVAEETGLNQSGAHHRDQ